MRKLIHSGKMHQKGGALAIRVLLNYCERNELMDFKEIDEIRRRIKPITEDHIDNFVPKDTHIFNSINKLNEIVDKKKLLVYRFILETSCRYTEAVHFFKNFDESKLEIRGDVCSYDNFFNRGNKSSFYLMFSKNLYDELKPLMKKIKESDLIYLKRKSQREDDLMCIKYLRKYTYTLMLMNGIPNEIANLISGRSNKKDVGITHYADKKELMHLHYPKILPKMNELISEI